MGDEITKQDLQLIGKSIDFVRDKVTDMKRDTEKINKILTGNGEPQKGLVIRIGMTEVRLSFVTKILAAIGLIIVAAVVREIINGMAAIGM